MREKQAEFRVVWKPDTMPELYFSVLSLEAGDALFDKIVKFDPDDRNDGGMEWKHPTLTGGEWEYFDHEDDFEREVVVNALAGRGSEER